LGDVRRKPSTYEAVTAKFHYHFRRDPAPFELDPEMPLNRWYLKHREGSPFQVDDWEGFRDPYKLTYKTYVELQHERETYLDGLVDEFEDNRSVETLGGAWVETLRRLFVPARFPFHVLQTISLYVGQMAPSSFVTNPSFFQAADEMRRLQRFAYWTKVLANAHGDDIATTQMARTTWENDEAWQPLREALERLMVAYDWGEAFVGLNFALKPAIDTIFDWELSELASANSDQFMALLTAELRHDAERSRSWTEALMQYALERDNGLRNVVVDWLEVWEPRAAAAADGLAAMLAEAPSPRSQQTVMAAVREHLAQHRRRAGL
jgi:toluene monooxygenase system protein E